MRSINHHYSTPIMISGFKISVLLFISLFIVGCSEPNPADPSCRVLPQALSSQTGKGACIIKLNNKLLVTINTDGLYDLAKTNNLSIQPAQCAAHNSLWLQTGFNAQVQHSVGVQKDGTWLYQCSLRAGYDGNEASFDAPYWSESDIKAVGFIDIFSTNQDQWAYPDELVFIRDAFIRAN
ncbi:hypothetical protein [Glaciecola petra]|uniref:Lipoprotein n=1 Tax=Glaciecola petra TaxID=3075602 RepID=A0ABU2ZL94_9ALTE|nr:hypothetical protein [Aestuariibacter sp. P117]MDT0593395.1 hypothetical protein [Aestuariibacter sp. P117]